MCQQSERYWSGKDEHCVIDIEKWKNIIHREREKRNITSYVNRRIVKMNLANLSEKKMYCALYRSIDSVDETGQLTKEEKT